MKRKQAAKFRNAVMAAHQLGIQKGVAKASALRPPMGPPPAPPPGAGGPPMPPPGAGAPPAMPPQGMKKGGSVWAKKACGGKVKKMAMGGSVRGGRGDGCAVKGKTKGRVC